MRYTIFLVIGLLTGGALFARQDPPPATQNPPASQEQDAAARAAARKKRFDEMKQQLENQNPQPPPQPAAPQSPAKPAQQASPERPSNVVATMAVTMLVDEKQRFFLYDNKRNNVTDRAHWVLLDNTAADLDVVNGVPNITTKQSGAALLYGTFSDRTAEVQITVLDREQAKANPAWVRWDQRNIDESAPLQIVPAIPGHVPHRESQAQ